jgi:hypothetical protein
VIYRKPHRFSIQLSGSGVWTHQYAKTWSEAAMKALYHRYPGTEISEWQSTACLVGMTFKATLQDRQGHERHVEGTVTGTPGLRVIRAFAKHGQNHDSDLPVSDRLGA